MFIAHVAPPDDGWTIIELQGGNWNYFMVQSLENALGRDVINRDFSTGSRLALRGSFSWDRIRNVLRSVGFTTWVVHGEAKLKELFPEDAPRELVPDEVS